MISKAWQWLVYSSENADRYSTTIKGLIKFVPFAVILFTSIHITVTPDTLTSLIDLAAGLVGAIGGLFAAVQTIMGLVKKISSTIKGTNAVVLGWKK